MSRELRSTPGLEGTCFALHSVAFGPPEPPAAPGYHAVKKDVKIVN